MIFKIGVGFSGITVDIEDFYIYKMFIYSDLKEKKTKIFFYFMHCIIGIVVLVTPFSQPILVD